MQIIEKIPITNDKIEVFSLLKYYIEKYEKQGNLDQNEQFELCQKMHELAVNAIKMKIN